ncbi:MAG TPA: HtaA domain-containing protein [Trebonia sp.]
MTGVLAWGVKRSLVSYATSAPGGQLLTTKDVKWEDGAFKFPLSVPSADGENGGEAGGGEAGSGEAGGGDRESYDFDGTVRFHGHFGMLVAELSALRIARGENGWTLSFADGETRVEAFTLDGEPERTGKSGDTPERLAWENVSITAAGSEVFGDHYPSGTLFDPLSIVF